MNNQSFDPNTAAAEAEMVQDALSASSVGCCKKMIAACKDMCHRFLGTRVAISYDMTTRIICGECGRKSQGQHATQGVSNTNAPKGKSSAADQNTMTKQGELELRLTDIVASAVMICAVTSALSAIKSLCGCCRSK